MEFYSGHIGGQSWSGWLVERESDLSRFRRWIVQRAASGERVAFDLETCGLTTYTYGPGFIRLAQFGTATEAWVVPVEHGSAFVQTVTWALRTLPKLCGHNVINFDGQTIDRHLGVKLEEFCPKVIDTMITSKLIDPREIKAGGIGAGLKGQAAAYIDPEAPDTQAGLTQVFKDLKVGHTKANPVGWIKVPWNHETYARYSMLDVILASRLLVVHRAELERLGIPQLLVDFEHELSRICATMSRSGLLVDADYTRTLYGKLDREYDHWSGIAAYYGVSSVDNAGQVVAALQGLGERWKEKTDTGNPSVAKDVLLPMADLDKDWERRGGQHGPGRELAEAVLRGKRALKWRSAYVDGFLHGADSDGLLHPNINTLQARTGRMSVTNPAVQTLPSGDWMIRRCLQAAPGERMISVDFKAVEMRVLAALADVTRMKEAIAAGADMHDFTARLVFGEGFTKADRKLAKGIGFGKVYGGGADTIHKQTGAPLEDIRRAIVQYDRVYPQIKRKSSYWQRVGRLNGMATTTITGRRLPLDARRMYAVVNYQCQSTARDILGQSLVRMDQAGLLPYLRLPIHDEVLAVAPEGEAADIARAIGECMTSTVRGVAIDSDPEIGGRTWGSMYLKDRDGKLIRDLAVRHDPYWATHAHELAA